MVKVWNDPVVWNACPPYKTQPEFLNDLEKRDLKVGITPVLGNTRRAELDNLYNKE